MKIAVVGSRDFPYPGQVERWLNWHGPCREDTLISGGARGVDRQAEEWARRAGVPVEVFPADWEGLGRRAGFVRNAQVVDAADRVVVFWDGMSPGSKSVINHCHSMMKDYEVHFPHAA